MLREVKVPLLLRSNYKRYGCFRGGEAMQDDLKHFLRDLADIYDKKSRNVYLSLYLTKESYHDTIRKRERAITSIVHGEERTNFSDTLEQVQKSSLKSDGITLPFLPLLFFVTIWRSPLITHHLDYS